MIKKVVINLTLNANKTFSIAAQNPDGSGKNKTATGTWTQTGNKVTINITKEDGKPATGTEKSQTLTVAANGKSMILIPQGAKGQGKVVFVR
jgi:hypothetical protein